MSRKKDSNDKNTTVVLLIALYVVVVLGAAVVSVGWTIRFKPEVSVPVIGTVVKVTIPESSSLRVPASVYIYSLMGALTYAFTFLIEKFDSPSHELVATALRIPAALPLAAGMYLLLGFFVDMTQVATGNLASTIAAAAFITGLYIGLALYGFQALAERLYGASTVIEFPPARRRPNNKPPGANRLVGRWVALIIYLVLLFVVIGLSLGWTADVTSLPLELSRFPTIQIEPANQSTGAFAPVHVPQYVYLFSLLGGLAYIFTFLHEKYSNAQGSSNLSSGQVLKLAIRLPAAMALGAGVFLIIDSGLLVLLEEPTIVEETVAGVMFLTGFYIQLALTWLERLGYKLAKVGKLDFVKIHPQHKERDEEFIVFRNAGGATLNLDGWRMEVQYTKPSETDVLSPKEYVFEDLTLDPDETVVLRTRIQSQSGSNSSGENTNHQRYWDLEESWGKYGDKNKLIVYDKSGRARITKSFDLSSDKVRYAG